MTALKKLRQLTDDEEARIRQQIADDPNAPEATDEELAQARPFAEALPGLAASMKRGPGRPPVEHPKERLTLRLSHDVVEHYRATGPGWQGRIDEALKKTIAGEVKQGHRSAQ